jgi:hypothetical protein
VAELLSDFRTLQYYIAAAPCNPLDMDDYYTEGWAALRQLAMDGQHILNCAADVTVPCATGGPEEQAKAELKQCVIVFLSVTASPAFPSPPSSSLSHSNPPISESISTRTRADTRVKRSIFDKQQLSAGSNGGTRSSWATSRTRGTRHS